MEHLPIFFDVKDRVVIVIGGETVAARKAEMALRAGARVEVFAETLSDDFLEIREHERFTHHARAAGPEDFARAALAYAALEGPDGADCAGEARRAKALAQAAGVPINVADCPELCDFIMPSILDRSPLVVAISTAGTSPMLGRMIKARLETMLPAAYGRLSAFVGAWRGEVMRHVTSLDDRRRFWEWVLDGPVMDLVLAGRESEAEEAMREELAARAEGRKRESRGEVYLVGAGPGDPDLLTFRALRLMQQADVVLYDRLIGDGILNLVRRDAERIYVGKLPQDHTVPQEEISEMLVRLAEQGKRVLRLKGGDPFIFGRGGEEIEKLARAGIPFQIVPGITAAAGCAAYAGIPLTHRDHAQACIFVTGHGKNGQLDLDWKTLLQPRQTIAIYMGLAHLADLMAEFIARGADPELPVAVIDKGTRRDQKVVTGTLATIAQATAGAELKGPAMIIIGTVVRLRDTLKWYGAGERAASVPDAQKAKAVLAGR